jgi:hypothetical protein
MTERVRDYLWGATMDAIAQMPGGDFVLDSLESRGEKAISSYMKAMLTLGSKGLLEPLPYTEHDTLVFEMPLRHGRADLVIFHLDGSASVMELKDGDRDVVGIAAGIGQVGYYAAQLGLTRSIPTIRRALAWSKCRQHSHNELLIEACRLAGVAPILLPSAEDIRGILVGFVCDQFAYSVDRMKEFHGLAK